MIKSVDVAIVGAGQAGLATSWFLTQAGADHVVLDRGRVAETWRSRRWDSFCLVTPNWGVKLPGASYAGPEPGRLLARAGRVGFFESWVASFRPPLQENTTVARLEADSDGRFLLSLGDRQIRARTVVVASGSYQKAHWPAGAETLPATLHQVRAEDYRNPAQLPPGNVLIVGSGQTGCQLAEELHEAGRKVLVACGRCPWMPRRIGGHDLVWWLIESGFMDRTPDMLPSPAAPVAGTPQGTGHGDGRDLHFRTLHAMGVELLGRFLGAEGSTVHFADDLAASVDFGDARWGGGGGRGGASGGGGGRLFVSRRPPPRPPRGFGGAGGGGKQRGIHRRV